MWYQIIAYLKFLFTSTNQHGVHSPFVFDLVTRCFYNTKKLPAYTKLKNYRNRLLQDHRDIEVTDFGAGSRVFKSNMRKVSAIAKNAGITPKRAQLLHRLVSYFSITNTLEIGTSLGIATIALQAEENNNNITTIEGCPQTAAIANTYFREYNATTISSIVGTFEEELPKLSSKSYDLIYFDGNHQKQPTLDYFDLLIDTAHNDSVFIFDDIHWSKSMTEAWETIKNHPKVTVTIDTFFWGFVFFRKEQRKEHFKIRL